MLRMQFEKIYLCVDQGHEDHEYAFLYFKILLILNVN